MEFCVHCLGTGEDKKCTCHDVRKGRDSRCQTFTDIPCIHCQGTGNKPTWASQVRPDIDNDFGVYK